MIDPANQSRYFITRWVYLRALGVIYLIAFLSIWVQVLGLLGENGILPVSDLLRVVSSKYGFEKYFLLPTIFWWSSSDLYLTLVPLIGVLISVFLIFDFVPIISLFCLWFLYLSLVVVGGDFLSFQWDSLLLEVGFFSIFFAPLKMLPGISRERAPSRYALWILRLILFKLLFLSGLVKLLSGDQAWHNLDALSFHYETQPLPNIVSWYVAKLPSLVHKFSVAVMFFIELIAPFSIFIPGAARKFGASLFIGLQILIILSGNYCFFNLLTMLLCLLLFDDEDFRKVISRLFVSDEIVSKNPLFRRPVQILHGALLFFWVFVSTATYYRFDYYWSSIRTVLQFVSPFRSVNSYGLFAVMTTHRDEIVIEGSYDGESWKEYGFIWKPGDIKKPPSWAAPHQPRLDWQMWFASLSRCERTSWFVNFLVRLLEGSKDVLELLSQNPFREGPPKFIRTKLYRYHFSDSETKRLKGEWWTREEIGNYCPVVSLSR